MEADGHWIVIFRASFIVALPVPPFPIRVAKSVIMASNAAFRQDLGLE